MGAKVPNVCKPQTNTCPFYENELKQIRETHALPPPPLKLRNGLTITWGEAELFEQGALGVKNFC